VDIDFGRAVERCLAEIPPGRVATCGAVARALGDLRAARAIATWLAGHPEIPGGHRVVRADGQPILEGASNLRADEGIRVVRGRIERSDVVDALPGIGFLERLREEQERLAAEVLEDESAGPSATFRRIAGVDASYRGEMTHVAAVSMDRSALEPMEVATVRRRTEFPYIPSYLAYREFPGIRDAVERLAVRPDLLLVDGHGRLHPAGFGIACAVGVKLGLPTVGIAKRLLVGRVESSSHPGDPRSVAIDGRIRGYAWVPPGGSRPIYVSVGHRISLEGAMRIALDTTRLRYPEPLRVADRISREMNRP
jgi:deoxyribonuclease V